MSGFPTVLYGKSERVAHVRLNRPEKVNAFNMQMRDDLWEALAAIEDDPDVRAVVFSGAGERGFCAGADLTEFGAAPSIPEARAARRARDVFGRLARLPKPTVGAVHGQVVGSGVELAALCDLRIASEDAVFSMPETGYGLIPAAGGTQTLPRLAGVSRAAALLLAGERLDAMSALRTGLVGRVAPVDRLMSEAMATGIVLRQLQPSSVTGLKEAVRSAFGMPLDVGIRIEDRAARRVAAVARP